MIGISTWCHLITPKAAPFLKDGSFPRSPATTSGQRLLSCISKDAAGVSSSQGSFQLWVSAMLPSCTVDQTPCGIALPRRYIFLPSSVSARGASWIGRLIRFFKKRPRWTEVIMTGTGLGSPNLPLVEGLRPEWLASLLVLSCVVMGKYTIHAYPRHRCLWVD